MEEFDNIPDDKLRQIFFNAIKSLEFIPHYEELVMCLPEEKRKAIRKECRRFENEFHERVFALLLPETTRESIGQLIETLTPCRDIPENFKEIMLLSPDNPQGYVESQRVGDKERFSGNNGNERPDLLSTPEAVSEDEYQQRLTAFVGEEEANRITQL